MDLNGLLTGIGLGVAFPEPFSGVFSLSMTLAENSRMCLNSQGSTRGSPYGANSMGPSMGAIPSAAVFKVVTRPSNDSRGRILWQVGAWSEAGRWKFLHASLPPSSCSRLSPST